MQHLTTARYFNPEQVFGLVVVKSDSDTGPPGLPPDKCVVGKVADTESAGGVFFIQDIVNEPFDEIVSRPGFKSQSRIPEHLTVLDNRVPVFRRDEVLVKIGKT